MVRKLFLGLLGISFLIALAAAVVPTSSKFIDIQPTRAVQSPRPQPFDQIDGAALAVPHPGVFAYTADTSFGQKHTFLDGIRPRSYVIYAGRSATAEAPAILLLHGAGRDAHSMIEMWKETADTHGLVLLALNAKRSGWALADAGPLVRLVSHASQHVAFDQTRVFLFGHSAGAIWAQVFTNRVQGPWRATATHGGYTTPASLIPVNQGVPIRAYLGSSDHIFNPAGAHETAQTFSQNGHLSQLVLIPNHTHWFYAIGPAIAQDAWHWFSTI